MSYIPTGRLFFLSAALALLLLAVLTGCALDPLPAPTPTPPPPTPTPLPRGGTLTIRLAGDVPDLRPWQPRSRDEEQITSLLYNGLTRLDAKLQPQPDLATAWNASPDGRLIIRVLDAGSSAAAPRTAVRQARSSRRPRTARPAAWLLRS